MIRHLNTCVGSQIFIAKMECQYFNAVGSETVEVHVVVQYFNAASSDIAGSLCY